ncbi:MAG TPA: phosphatase PAP2 family protein [Verrucomicrobiae bacterium]|nr:phosphatase PAP2 family protein [Verrucomicrobiae bacterium]
MQKAIERTLPACKPDGLRVSENRPLGKETWRVLFWVVFCLALLGLGFLVDGPVGRALTLQSSDSWWQLAFFASKAGEGWVVAVFGIAGSLSLFLLRRFHASRGVFLVALTGLMTGATATIIRSLVGRTRPDSHELQGFYGVWHDSHWIIGKYEFGAFPSGHVATVIGLAAATWLINRKFGALAGMYALLVSWSRIALGCHHLSDEIAAAIIGVCGAYVVFSRLGPVIKNLGENLEKFWLKKPRASL